MGDPYAPRNLVWVLPFVGSSIKYGFQTNLSDANGSILGHNKVDGAYPTGLVIGCNAPKPPRYKKDRSDGSDTSYGSADKHASIVGAGWVKIKPGKVRIPSTSAKSVSAYVVHQGNKIGWRMPKYLTAKMQAADATALGIKGATKDDLDICWGCSYPKLPRVAKWITAQGSTDRTRVSTVCDPSKLDSLPDGWVTIKTSTEYSVGGTP